MKIAPLSNKHQVLVKFLAFLIITFAACPAFCTNVDCESDFEKPTIRFPEFPDVISGDTMYFDCMVDVLGVVADKALVSDNCDPDPLIGFGEFCQESGDCSKGYKYLAKCIWTVVDNNNNVTEFVIYAAIQDKNPPRIILNWGNNILSGDTLYMECGEADSFDESYVSTEDGCDLSLFCEEDKPFVNVFFQERVIGAGNCDDYVTEMSCSWTATDDCGNSSVFELVIFVTDNTPPKFINIPDSYCGSRSLTEEQFQEYRNELSNIEVEDYCSNVELKYTIGGRSDGCSYNIQWEATDACGNTSYYKQLVCIAKGICTGQISGTVKVDNNKDRVGDEPISEVTLFLVEDVNGDGQVDGGETVYLTTTTDVNGFYRFSDVPQGCYVIVELQPNGLADSRDEDVTNPGGVDKDGTNDPIDNLIPVCVGPGEFDDGNDFVEEQFVLEVVLSSFEASYIELDKSVDLVWQTEYELNADYFLVERSVDGTDFFTLAKVNSKSENKRGFSYSHLDDSLPEASILYYRLRDVDTDGSENYSNIISVEINNSSVELLVYPNPSSGVFSVHIGIQDQNVVTDLQLYDISGNLVLKNFSQAANIDLDVSHLQKGTYLLKVSSVNGTVVKKIVLAE